MTPPAPNETARIGWLGVGLNLFGIAVVAYTLGATDTERLGHSLLTVAIVGLVAWLIAVAASVLPALALTAPSWLLPTCFAVMAVCGSLVAAPTFGLGIALTVAALLRVIGNPAWPLWWGGALTLLSAALVAIGALLTNSMGDQVVTGGISALGLVAIEGGIVVAALGGVSRRQLRTAEAQSAALGEERLAAREKQALLSTLAERQAIARDIHDVLAHSLGGLVIQLDAVEALLEAGETAAAERRVHDARRLAASGLAEARRAVDALRDPSASASASVQSVPVRTLQLEIVDLVDADRALGATVTLTMHPAGSADTDESWARARLGGDAVTALRRLVQEGLANARKHAGDAEVKLTITLDLAAHSHPEETASIRIRMVNALAEPIVGLSRSGAGHGLAGMHERFAALAGASVRAGRVGDRFEVDARVPVDVTPTPDATPAKLDR